MGDIRMGTFADSLDTTTHRVLQNSNEDPDVFEFLGFVAWYLFLVVCCIIPTACAYRRRRMHQNLSRQQQQQQQNQLGTQEDLQIYFNNLRFSLRQDQEEVTQNQIQDALQKTTMQVEAQDLLKLHGESFRLAKKTLSSGRNLEMDENEHDDNDKERPLSNDNDGTYSLESNLDHVASGEEKVEDVPMMDEEVAGIPTTEDDLFFEESEREFSHVQLPDGPNGDRVVPSACAICLCAYEVGDEVTWSPEEQCQHAFHRDCIVSWLGKKREHLCPCCRQKFCIVEPATNNESTIAPNDNGIQHPPPLETSSSFP